MTGYLAKRGDDRWSQANGELNGVQNCVQERPAARWAEDVACIAGHTLIGLA